MIYRFAYVFGWLASVLPLSAPASAAAAGGSNSVVYAPPQAWVVPPPAGTDAPSPPDAPIRIVYLDNQVHVSSDGTEDIYTAYRVKILKPEGLSIGNIVAAWEPGSGSLTAHSVQLIRGGRATDILATLKFTVLQREARLEQSMLDGQRTATLQVPGLQVGDEIAFALTVRNHEPVFGGKVGGLLALPALGTPGTFRDRLIWPKDRAITLQASRDLGSLISSVQGKDTILEVILRDPKGALPTEGAPPRDNIRRLIEFSDFGTWADLASLMSPPFEQAARISPNSPIRAEAAAIAARTQDPSARAEAALELVEDRIRYVYVGLDGGNYLPASADLTWQRRFGDCKAKTAILVALLRELGIDAEPALVNSQNGDGLDERLPDPRLFDHVVVRATIAGRPMWLDGTRLGDRDLGMLPRPWRWSLPLDAESVGLERIVQPDVAFPQLTGIYDIDASAGLDQDAKVTVRTIMRGDEAFALRQKLVSLSSDDLDRGLKSYWRQQVDWLTPDSVQWSYDDRRMALLLGVTGRGNPGWKSDGKTGHTLTIVGAGFYAPDPKRRPLDQDKNASWTVPFPRFRCYATTIRLPKPTPPYRWSLYADPMNQRLGGVVYWRAAGMNGPLLRTVMSSHSYEDEASPHEASILNQAIPSFNNNMSSIAEEKPADVIPSSTTLPFGDNVDWLAAPTPCSPPDSIVAKL